MDLRDLTVFKTVAELKSFTRAGEKLYVSHSAISRQIKLLEEELRCPLFIRGRKRVTLTEAGTVLLGCTGPIFELFAKAVDSVSQASMNTASTLSVGTGTNMLHFFLPPVLDRFRKRHPSTPVLIKTGYTVHIIEDLRQGNLDVGIVSLPLPIEGRDLSVKPLYREELVAVVGPHHPFANRKLIRAEELKNSPIIILPKGSSTRLILDTFFRERDISPIVQLELENEDAAEKALKAGLAIAFLAEWRARKERLNFVRIVGHEIFREIGLVRVQSKVPREHVTYFASLCSEQATHLVSSQNRLARPAS
jgi:DNA-binding transcriptional LysR family regulator